MLQRFKKLRLHRSSYLGLGQEISLIHNDIQNQFRLKVKSSRSSFHQDLNLLAQNIYERNKVIELEALEIRYEYQLKDNLQLKFWIAPLIAVCVAFIWPENQPSTEIWSYKTLSSLGALIATTYWLKINHDLNQYLRVVKLTLLIHKQKSRALHNADRNFV